MNLQQKITINTQYTRSVNIERDADSGAIAATYIPTSRAVRTLEKISATFGSHQAPRAWSLVGPYGSGKSVFSVFLSHLLSDQREVKTKTALTTLGTACGSTLSNKFKQETAATSGYLKVLIAGAPEPLGRRILKGTAQAASEYWGRRRGPKPGIVAELQSASERDDLSVAELLDLVTCLQDALTSVSGTKAAGILLVIDELGKFLEYEVRHYGANDIFLLQALAEHACAGAQTNLSVVVLLHQSFEQYAKGLGENLTQEWSKVQGRFEEVPFLESAEQMLRVAAAAFNQDLSRKEKSQVVNAVKTLLPTLEQNKVLPGSLSTKDARELFVRCYPLHPVTALLLPQLCQKVAQNERTLFSYLGSHEEFGLQYMLEHMGSVGDWIFPHHIFDYFITNQPAVLGDYLTHRRWAEVVAAIERLGDSNAHELALLKTIGVHNITGSKGGLKASQAVLEACSPDRTIFRKSIKALRDKSIISFRRFSSEYRVWQGSDFDLEGTLQEELGKLGSFSLVQELNQQNFLMPVVARKYTVQNGALRYFEPLFADADTYNSLPVDSDIPRIILYLAFNQDDTSLFYESVTKYFTALDIVVLCPSVVQLHDSTAEVQALNQISANCQELNNDPVAKLEFDDRLQSAEHTQQELLKELLNRPQDNKWFWKNSLLPVSTKRELQEVLSKVLGTAYHKAPIIRNELINRDKPSSQAAAGRNKLLSAMLKHGDQVDLAIEKFPPEKAMYRALLKETGLHGDMGDMVGFKVPPSDGRKDRSKIRFVWHRIDEFLATTEKQPLPFSTLSAELMAPPYGVKAGVLPVLYMTAYLTYQYELAIYENGIYTPSLSDEALERFVKVPQEFAVQRFRVEGLRASIFDQYTKALYDDGKKRTVIELIRPLASFIRDLPEFTKKTRSAFLSPKAQAVRNAFNLAKSPERLLFVNLPKALGFDEYGQSAKSMTRSDSLESFAAELQKALAELKHAYSNMLKGQQRLLAQAFHIDQDLDLSQLRQRLAGLYQGLEQYTVDIDGMRAFIKRLTKDNGNDEDWLNDILMFLGQKPTAKWTDADLVETEIKLSNFSKRILDLRTLRLHYDKSAEKMSSDFDVILLKSLKKGTEPIDEVVAIDKTLREALQGIKSELHKVFLSYSDKELCLAALAEYVDEFLKSYRENGKTKIRNKHIDERSSYQA